MCFSKRSQEGQNSLCSVLNGQLAVINTRTLALQFYILSSFNYEAVGQPLAIIYF
jgi:hypothetical protein